MTPPTAPRLPAAGERRRRHAGEFSRWARVGAWQVHARHWPGVGSREQRQIVLVHGLGVASRMCRPLAQHLPACLDVYAPDLPGFGESTKPEAILDVGEQGEALARWMAAVGIERAAVVGTSLGCQVAVAAAAANPARIDALVLGSPTVDRTRRRWRSQLWRWQLEQLTQSFQLRRIQVSDFRTCGLKRVLGTFASALRDRPEQRLGDLPHPVLVCRGTRDPLLSQRWVAELADTAPSARLAVLPGGLHALCHENPLAFSRVITRFLDRHASTRS